MNTVLKKKLFQNFLKTIKRLYSRRNHCNGVLQEGGKIGLNSEYKKEKWRFIAKEQGQGSVDGKMLRGNIRDKGKFRLNQLDKILAEGRARVIRHHLADGAG